MNNKTAIIMAAGLGTRMRPLTLDTAKPLIKICGTPMIETVIEAVKKHVSHIYVVVGYKKEQFLYLTEKYQNLTLIENAEYLSKNNISSIYAARDFLNTDCFICEADLYISDAAIFDTDFTKSCYFGKFVEGESSDWIFETKNGRITRVKKGGRDLYNMAGISYWRKEDAVIIKDATVKAYTEEGHEKLYWDEIVDRELNKIDAVVHPVKPEQIIEIDTVDELNEFTERRKKLC